MSGDRRCEVDPETIRLLREEYRRDTDTLNDAEETGEHLDSNQLNDMMKRANGRLAKLKSSREGALDSELLGRIIEHGRKTIEQLAQSTKIDSGEVVDALGNFVSLDRKNAKTFGAYDTEILSKDPVQKLRKERQKMTNKFDKTHLKEVSKVDTKTQKPSAEGTSVLVDACLKKLRDYCSKNEGHMNYFKYVVDPKSFGRTVENMFHVSFLVRDGHVGINVVDDQPFVYMMKRTKQQKAAEEQTRKHIEAGELEEAVSSQKSMDDMIFSKQCILSINMQQWKELVDAYDIKHAFLTAAEYSASTNSRQDDE